MLLTDKQTQTHWIPHIKYNEIWSLTTAVLCIRITQTNWKLFRTSFTCSEAVGQCQFGNWDSTSVPMGKWEYMCVRVFMCVRERDTKRGRGSVCGWGCIYTSLCVGCVFMLLQDILYICAHASTTGILVWKNSLSCYNSSFPFLFNNLWLNNNFTEVDFKLNKLVSFDKAW